MCCLLHFLKHEKTFDLLFMIVIILKIIKNFFFMKTIFKIEIKIIFLLYEFEIFCIYLTKKLHVFSNYANQKFISPRIFINI